jgi:hypothetical protein
MDVYVLAVAMHPPSQREDGLRLEEMTYRTSAAALEMAGVSRRELDSLTIGACDELDGRPISSMLMAAPAGGYRTDEIKVTDSGASALCLAVARMLAGESELGLVASWCKTSKIDVETVMRWRGDPFFTRPLGIGASIADALFAQASGVTAAEASERAVKAFERAARNARGMKHRVPSRSEVDSSPYEATPLRAAQRAPLCDGAVSLVLASEAFLRSNPKRTPLAQIAAVGWASDSYRLSRERLAAMQSARRAWDSAVRRAGLGGAADLDVVELECPTSYHEGAYVRALGIEDETKVSPSGGSFAQYPLFCSGLVNAAEAVLQVAGQAGAVQKERVNRAAAHSCHGYAQQGNVVMIFEAVGGA